MDRSTLGVYRLFKMTEHNPDQPLIAMADNVHAFNRLIQPYMYVDNPQRFTTLVNLHPNEKIIHHSVVPLFSKGRGLPHLIERGNFEDLLQYASTAAAELHNTFEPTLPNTFAVHALASILTSTIRPFDERVPHSNDRTTYFLTQFAARLAAEMPAQTIQLGPDPYKFAKAVRGPSGRLARKFGESPGWIHAKHGVLAERLLLKQHISEIIDNEPDIEVRDIAELRANNDALFSELRRLERHNITTAVHKGLHSDWSIDDLVSIHTQQALFAEREQSSIHPERWRPTMVLSALEHNTQGKNIAAHYAKDAGTARPNYEEFRRYAYMDDQGQLYSDPHGAMPLAPAYETAGKPANYEVLRQFLMQKYCDLSVPTRIVQTVEQHTEQWVGSKTPDIDRERGIVYSDLLLPRILLLRRFKTPDELDAA